MSIAEQQFGKNLHRARRRAGVSQEDLAVLASLHRTEIGLLERGERLPRIDTAIKLAGALALPLASLVEGIDWQPGSTQAGAFSLTVGSSKGAESEQAKLVSSIQRPKTDQ